MRLFLRATLLGVLAATALLGLATPALGFTISPSGTYTSTSRSVSLTLASNGTRITCTSASIVETIDSGGRGTISPGGATFSGCTHPLLGRFTITQATTWHRTWLLQRITVGIEDRSIVGYLLSVVNAAMVVNGGGCTTGVGGSGVLYGMSPGEAAVLPIAIPPQLPRLTDLGLTASNSTCGLIPNGLRVSLDGTWTLSRTFTISG